MHVNRVKVGLKMGKEIGPCKNTSTLNSSSVFKVYQRHNPNWKLKTAALRGRGKQIFFCDSKEKVTKMLLLCCILPDQVEIRRKGQGTREKVSQWAIKCRTKKKSFNSGKIWMCTRLRNQFRYIDFVPFIFLLSFSQWSPPLTESKKASPPGVYFILKMETLEAVKVSTGVRFIYHRV